MTNGWLLDQDGPVQLEAAARLVRLIPVASALADHEGHCIEHSDALVADAASVVDRLAGRLTLRDGRPQQQWLAALAREAGGEQSARFTCSLACGEVWRIQLVAVSCQVDAVGGVRLLFLVTFTQASSPRALTVDSRFTPAEMEVLARLLQGYGAKQIAKPRCASVNTIRSQITSILHKAGLHSQTRAHRLVRPQLAFGASEFDTDAPQDADELRAVP